MGEGEGRFVGRQQPLREVTRLLASTARGGGSLIVVTGDAGIGKTRFCEEVAAQARSRGDAVAWAACWESGAAAALWPWRQLVRDLLGRRPEAKDGVAADRSRWLGVIAGDGRVSAGDDPDTARLEMADAVAALLREAAGDRALLVVIDDLHWADAPSLRLLATLAPLLRAVPVAVAVTWRETDAGGDLAAVAPELLRRALVVALAGLAPDEVGEMVESTTGAPPDSALVDALHRRAGGNPLFTSELLRLGADLEAGVPPTAVATLGARIRRLSIGCRAMLAVAAVAGDDFSVDLVARAAGLTAEAVLTGLDEAASARLVVAASRPSRFMFVHALARAAALEGHGLAERVRLHAAAGAALEAQRAGGQPVEAAALAYQFAAAAALPGCAAKAVVYSRQAAADAMRQAAYEDAARLLRQARDALDLGAGAADRASLLCDLGDAEQASGATEDARRAYREAAAAARVSGRPDVFARAALGVGGGEGFEVALADGEQIDLLEEALALLGSGEPALRSRVCGRLSIALTYGPAHGRRHALAEEAVALARASGDEDALARALAVSCDAISGPAQLDARERAASEVVDLAERCHDRRLELLGRRLRAMAVLERGDVHLFDREVDGYEAVARSLRLPHYLWLVPLWRAMRAGMEGDVSTAAALRAEAADLGRQGGSANASLLCFVQQWCELLENGRGGEALAVLESFVVDGLESTSLLLSRCLTLASAGRRTEAREQFERIAGRLPGVPVDAEWLAALCQVAVLVDLLGGHPVAAWAYDALVPFADQFAVEGIGAWCRGSIEEYLGLLARALGRPAVADRHFAAAVAANEAAGATIAARRSAGQRAEQPAGRAAFRRDGETWELAWAGVEVRVRDRKGLADLARLLAAPGREIAAVDLAGTPVVDAGGDAVLDQPARDAYTARLREIEGELDESDRHGDPVRSGRLAAERDALVEQLVSAYGLGGRARTLGPTAADRARSTVTQRIRDALRHLEPVHPELADHLRASVRTGAFCSYAPREPVSWIL